MPDLDLTTLLVAELAIALLVLCLVLLWHARRQGRAMAALEAEVVALRQTPAAVEAVAPVTPVDPEPVPPITTGSADGLALLLDEQLEATRRHHEGLGVECDIALDFAPESPLERQALALRYAMLSAEKEALLAALESGGAEPVDWSLLFDKLGRLIAFYRGDKPAEPNGPALRALLADYNRQSRDMLGALGTLEQELQQLRARLGESDDESSAVDMEAAAERYRELEARYLELEE